MKSDYAKYTTTIACIAVLFLQGLWLYNTYKLIEADFQENISSLLITSLEKEMLLRVKNSETRRGKGKAAEGYLLENDRYTNNRAHQDFLYKYDYGSISLDTADSIFNESIQKQYESLGYSLFIIDSLGNRTANVSHGEKKFNGYLDYKETVQLRNIASEYITLTVFSPHITVFGKMLLLLAGSFVLAVVVVYGLILQIRLIARQKRISELRKDFTHSMIHDIKNPLTTILKRVDSLKSDKMEDKPQIKEDYFRIIAQEGQHILSIINQILTIARQERDKFRLSKQTIDLSAIKSNYAKYTTVIACIAVLFLQGLWLYNTYKLIEADFQENLSSLLITSLEKETVPRVKNSKSKKGERKTVEGYLLENDRYTNNRAHQDFLYKYEYDPISLETVDSIFNESIQKQYESLMYSLFITDSLGNRTANVSHGEKKFNGYLDYRETVQLRNIAPEYITLTVFSPYITVFGKMFLLLFGSFILAVVVVYGLILQIRLIARQKRVSELRKDFTHAMIHDIKNPLTAILMGVNSLKSGKMEDKPQMKEKFFRIIAQEGDHILSITNRILTIARLETDKLSLSRQTIDLPAMMASLTEKYQLNTTKDVRFHTELNGVERIYADYGYIFESFDNILDNAVKYSKEQVNIVISCRQTDKYTEIKFRDDGIGISAGDRRKIFEKFERASAVRKNRKVSGFGLGLNYAYRVVTAHGGTIEVESAPGKYSEFTIYLPYDENDQTITG
jgi:two-component system phosphate regulon sensor histidine kinase PhoR